MQPCMIGNMLVEDVGNDVHMQRWRSAEDVSEITLFIHYPLCNRHLIVYSMVNNVFRHFASPQVCCHNFASIKYVALHCGTESSARAMDATFSIPLLEFLVALFK